MLWDLFQIVFKNLKSRRLRSWLTMIGIFIGIAAVVSLISLGEGLEKVVTGQFDLLGTDVLTIQASGPVFGPPGSGSVTPLTTDNLEAVKRVAGVDFAGGRIVDTLPVEFNNKINYGFVGSIMPGRDGDYMLELLNYEASAGRILRGDDHNKVTVGHDYSDSDKFDKPVMVGSNIIVNGYSFEVVGIIKKKGSFIIDNTIIMTEENMRAILEDNDNEYSAMLALVKDGVKIDKVKEDIEKVLRKERDVDIGEEDFVVESNDAALENLTSTLFAVQLFVYIIAGISIIVGGIGITNTMYTSVIERTDEIGIMKAIGATNKNIFTLFFLESGLLGTVGGLIGILLGVGIAKGAEFGGRMALGTGLLSAHITPWLIIGALLFSFIIGTISGLVPALKAAKLQPVEALRD